MKILVASEIHDEVIDLVKDRAEIEVIGEVSEDELAEKVKDAEGLIVRSKPKVTRKVIENGKKLRVIARAGVGVDNIDVAAATEKGIIVVNAPEATTTTVAEHTFALLLALARKIPQADASTKSGKWEKSRFMGTEVRGKTIGIIGLGRIGSRVAEFAKAFGMSVLAYDPYISEERAGSLGIKLSELDRLIKTSDYITIHVPKTEKTSKLIGDKELKMMKKTACIINCARGGIVDEKALYSALSNHQIAAAALDVFESEPPKDSPLLRLENVIVTPHLGASTEEAQKSAGFIVMQDVLAVLENRMPKNVVNMPSIKPEAFEKLREYIAVCEKLGIFCSQIADARIKELYATYCGELSKLEEVEVLTSVFLKGLLSPILLNSINYINAGTIAKNRGIKIIHARREDSEEYENLMLFSIKTDKGETVLKASLIGGREGKIVEINSYKISLAPEGNTLIITHEDRPGMIGKIATAIGKNNINIGFMEVGRKKRGEKQLMVIKVDEEIKTEAAESIKAIEGVLEVKAVKM